MLIPIGIPAESHPNAIAPGLGNAGLHGTGQDVQGLNGQDLCGLSLKAVSLNGASGPLLADPKLSAIAAATPLTTQPPGDGAVNLQEAAASLDPLTPLSLAPGGATALASVITSVSTTLDTMYSIAAQSTNPEIASTGIRELLQSPRFQQVFQLLGNDELTGSRIPDRRSNLAAPGESFCDVLNRFAGDATDPYFERLLGELESTFRKTQPRQDAAGDTASEASQLDMLLPWLALNGSHNVVASA